MSLEKYLNKVKIEKVIDPGVGDEPASADTTVTNLPSDVISEREVTQTPIAVLVDDLITQSQNVQILVASVISEINEANKSDLGFSIYHDMVKANSFNPKSLITDSTAKPVQVYTPNQVKAAERDVYRRCVDTRAPFMQDLYDIAADAGLSEYTLSNFWKGISIPNSLYSSFDGNELAYYALAKEQAHLNELKSATIAIQDNKVERLAHGFMSALANKVISNVSMYADQKVLKQIESTVALLKQIKSLLVIVSILNTSDWEKFAANLKDIFGNFLHYTATRLAKQSAHAIIGGIHGNVTEFLDGLDSYLPFDVGLTEVPEVTEFMNQVEYSLLTQLTTIEDDFLARESIETKMNESRALLLANSRKNSKTKQFLDLLDQIIIVLDAMRASLANVNANLQLDVDTLTQTLVNKADAYVKKVATRPTTMSRPALRNET